MRILVTLLCAMTLLCSLAPLAVAGNYVVGVEAIDYYPLYAGKDGEYKGYGRALLDAFASDAGHTFTYKPLPVARLFATFLETDELDLKYPDNKYWSSEGKEGKNVVYSAPTVHYIDGVSVLPDNKGMDVDEVETLGIIRGFTAWEYLDRIKAGELQTDESNDHKALLKKALRGRVDGAYSNVVVVQHTLEQLGKPGALVFAEFLPHTRSAYHLSSIKHPELIEEFNAWMEQNGGKVQQLKEEYGVEVE